MLTENENAMLDNVCLLYTSILVQENDYVRAGTPLSDGAITPADILAIKGPTAVQEYICLLYTSVRISV